MKTIRILIVDDSPFRCDALEAMLNSDPEIKVIGRAYNGREAVELTEKLRPAVITTDIKMPDMDGIEAIKIIMSQFPTPIIVVSTSIVNEVKFGLQCLQAGALDFVTVLSDLERMAEELIYKIKLVSEIKVMQIIRPKMTVAKEPAILKKEPIITKIVAIAVSTGGPPALETVLSQLPADFPCCIVIVQHIPEFFSKEMARWLDEKSELEVKEATHGDKIEPGLVYIAPGGKHLQVGENGFIMLSSEPADLINIPSADVMMRSVAKAYGRATIGVIMTGMGHDGVLGINAVKNIGGRTIAQDEESSMVFGMNQVAIESGCIDRITPLENIAHTIMSLL